MYSTKNTSVLSRLISGVLAAVLLLPMLVFTALPYSVMAEEQRVKLPEGVFDMTTAIHGIYEE